MTTIDEYPDIMTVHEVADLLRISESSVYSLKGLNKIRVGNGRGIVRYKKSDVLAYIKSKTEVDEESRNAGDEKKRHRKVGVPPLLSWKELQAARLGYSGKGS